MHPFTRRETQRGGRRLQLLRRATEAGTGTSCATTYPTAFVLSGGGSAGAAQVGMLRALFEAGIRPDLLIGCSVGALNAAFVAADPRPGRIDELAAFWAGIGRSDIFGGTRRSQLAHLLRRDAHLYEPDALRALVARALPIGDLGATEVPVEVVTTDLRAGQARWWRHGDPVEVLVASASLPGLFPPVPLDGGLHVDGGVLANTPTARAVELGAADIYVLDVSHTPVLPDDSRRLRALDVLLASFAVARQAAAGDPLAAACPHQTVRTVPTPDVGADGRDFSRTAALMAEGYELTAAWLAGSPAAMPGDDTVTALRCRRPA